MSKHHVLSSKPQLRLEWRGQDGQNETEQPDHSANLGDSITASTRIRFSVHTEDIVAFANQLVAKVTPQTVANYLSHLGAVFAIARPAWGYPLDQSAMKDAFVVTNRLGVSSKSRERDRRPTLDELDKLMEHFGARSKRRPSSVPMQKIIGFAIFSTRRQEEITRISWIDLDTEGSRVLVRDMKNPGEKIGNDTWCDLPPEALQIILSMPRTSDEIFPYSTDAIGAAFTRAGQFLEIDDLHFHDLRHDGVSRLFEIGLNIPRVASVSGHRSGPASSATRTHLRQTGDKYAGWKWLPVVTVPKHLSPVERRKVVTRSPPGIATTDSIPGELQALKSRRRGTTKDDDFR
jgi:integrase